MTDLWVEPDPHEDLASIDETKTHPGAQLRWAREERGRTIADAVRGTRIPEHHLQALESDASLEEFPAPPYARFFL